MIEDALLLEACCLVATVAAPSSAVRMPGGEGVLRMCVSSDGWSSVLLPGAEVQGRQRLL